MSSSQCVSKQNLKVLKGKHSNTVVSIMRGIKEVTRDNDDA